MKDQTNEEPLDPMPGELPVTAGRPGTTSARHEGKHGAAPVNPDALVHFSIRCQVPIWMQSRLRWRQL